MESKNKNVPSIGDYEESQWILKKYIPMHIREIKNLLNICIDACAGRSKLFPPATLVFTKPGIDTIKGYIGINGATINKCELTLHTNKDTELHLKANITFAEILECQKYLLAAIDTISIIEGGRLILEELGDFLLLASSAINTQQKFISPTFKQNPGINIEFSICKSEICLFYNSFDNSYITTCYPALASTNLIINHCIKHLEHLKKQAKEYF